MQTSTRWISGLAFESRYRNHLVSMDSSIESGGTDTGVSPKALLLCALAGCTGMDIVSILAKMKVPFSSLDIDVTSEQTKVHPKVFREIYLTFRIKSSKQFEDKINRAVQLSYDKYCGVAAMLKKHSGIVVKVIVEE